MITSKIPIYLASKSPRRIRLLQQLGLDFKSFSFEFEEELKDGEHPIPTVKRLASHKLERAVQLVKNGILITADTIVVLNKEIIGKPKNEDDAKRILKKLSGKTHFVYTGYALLNQVSGKSILDYEKTAVTFRKLSPLEIENYVKSGSPMDKAGAYGIQDDFGAVFVEKVNGCYYNVMGLPLAKIYKSLKEII
ncbi:MAG: septum formation protein Maf [Ignavibacteria bacterium RBG_13_36_8]|nr:MAG: septum formation protein Maf [Ignavibacteria bacterium RBG_13_36_8]